jgi:ABC-2 type transport system ATP-binding protein
MPVLPTEHENDAVKTLTSPPAITANGLSKSYDGKVVLDAVDVTVAAGTVFALLGPNGAGKTTMVNIFATLLEPDAGQVQIAGHATNATTPSCCDAAGTTAAATSPT